ncbi:toxin glutamine deamidase domain-containing protein [Cryptosporangium japonicum]|uniref:Tox-PL domain-containing protein n=1 Tax=Cryptosporangium japonicum TaxID=80872 RepID=A0ABN0UWR2_9ACTN
MAVWKPDFGEYDYVWDFICGVTAGNPWPEGNEDDLWALAEEWTAVAQALSDAMQDAGPVVNDLMAAWGGDSGYAFLGLWEVLGQSSEAGLGAVAEMASSLADMSDHAALELQYNKLTTLITVIITIISVFTALIGAFFTGGGSAAAIQPIMTGGRIAVQQSFRQLVRNIARKVVEKELRKELLKKAVTREGLRKLGKEAAEELVEEVLEEVVLVDGLSQAIQMAGGHRTSWDGSKTAASAIGATAGVPIGMGVAPAVRWAKNRAGRLVTDRLSDATIDRINRGIDRTNSPTTRFGGLGKQFAGTPGQAVSVGLVNAVTSPTSSWIANGVVYGNWQYPADSIMSSALAGASRANTISPAQLAAAYLTGGPTAFRETLLGSHQAALSWGVPTTPDSNLSLPGSNDSLGLGASSHSPTNASGSVAAQVPLSFAGSSPGNSTDTSISASTSASTVPSSSIAAALAPFSNLDPTAPMPASKASVASMAPSLVGEPASPLVTKVATHSSRDETPIGSTPMANSPAPSANPSHRPVGHLLDESRTGGASPAAPPASAPTTVERGATAQLHQVSPSQQTAATPGPESAVGIEKEEASGQRTGLRTNDADRSARVSRNRTLVGPDRLAVPASPAGQGMQQGRTSPSLPPPRQTSTAATGQNTYSYRIQDSKFDPSENLQERAAQKARELAVVVRSEIADQRWDEAAKADFAPRISGSLVTADGVVRTHTSIKTDEGAPEPTRHETIQKILNEIRNNEVERVARNRLAERAGRAGDGLGGSRLPLWHGFCAEVALLSDFLFDFDQKYTGPEPGRLDAQLAALRNAQIISIQIWSDFPNGEDKVRPPCFTCEKLLERLGVEQISAEDVSKPARKSHDKTRAEQSRPPLAPGGERPIGEPGGLDEPDPVDQRALEDAVPRDGRGRPVRFPHPLGRWLGLVNDGGPAATPFRANNCLDTALSLLGTWQGKPQVSAPRKAEYYADDTPSTAGETDGRQRAEETLGAEFEYQGASADAAFPALSAQLLAAGHGASAVLITSVAPRHGGGSHAWNAVNHHGTIHWIDAQIGAVSTRPLFEYAVDGVWSIVLDPSGRAVRAGDIPTVVRGMASIEEDGKAGGGAPAAPTVPLTSFAPDGRADHLPDLEPAELLAAAALVRPEDFKGRLVESVDVGEAVTVRLRDGRSIRFEAAVASGMEDVAATAVGRNRNVVTVNVRVAPEQLARVWVHEIAVALQEKAPRGFFRRALERVLCRGAGADALLEARLSERRYLVRALGRGGSAELSRELDELDRYLSDAGVRRLPRRPVPALVPVAGNDRDSVAAAVSSRLAQASYAGFGVRVGAVDAGSDRVVVRLDVVNAAGRQVGIVHFSVNRDASGALYARLEQLRMNESGAGFVTTFNSALESWLVESGVSRVEVRAVDAGAFAWARRGFYWGSRASAESVFSRLSVERGRVAAQASVVRRWLAGELVPQDELEAVAADYRGVAPEAVLADLERQVVAVDRILLRAGRAEFGSPGYPSPNEVALAGWSGVGSGWAGRRALVGAKWEGVRWLDAALRPDAPAGAESSDVGPVLPRQMMKPTATVPVGTRAAAWSDLGFANVDEVPSDIRLSIENAFPYVRMVDPTRIAFTQRSISEITSDRIDIDDLVQMITAWRGKPLHGVQWGDGSLVSIDNRRLTAARRAGITAVPFVPHAPTESLLDERWRHDWPRRRRRKAALSTEIRELPDGSWVVGGDVGKVVYEAGAVPQTFGEIALFRAALGRDLLPGILFGSHTLPVRVGSPPTRANARSAIVQVTSDEMVAVERDLASVAGQLELRLARRSDESALNRDISEDYFGTKPTEIPSTFSLELPGGEQYGRALEDVVQALKDLGYEALRATNTWGEGNATQGLRISWRSPHSDRVIDLLLPTDWSARIVEETTGWSQILAHPDESAARKIHVILRRLMLNGRVARSRIPDQIDPPPRVLANVWVNQDDSLAAWVAKLPGVFSEYQRWLSREGWQLGDVIAEYGLGERDLPIPAEARERLERWKPDGPDLLHALQELHGGSRADERGDPGPDDVGRSVVEPSPEGMGLRPGSGAADSLRAGQLGSLPGGGPDGGGGFDSGDHGRGDFAGRGDDSVALPVEGGAAGAGSAVVPPADPAGGASWSGPAGPFAREDPAFPLDLTRGFGKQRLRRLENRAYQSAVDKVLSSADGILVGADPRFHPYGALINDGGPTQPGRDINCLDCSLAAISSFYGRPEVSMARWPDGTTMGELRGIERAMGWLDADTWLHHDHLPSMTEQFWALHDHVAELGPGSAALVVNVWQDADENGLLFDAENRPLHGESHATVVVFPLGADGPVWWDPQEGATSDTPPDDLVSDTVELSYITVELDGRVNGDGTAGYEGSGAGLPGSRLPSRPAVEHAPVPARVGASVDSGNAGGSRAGATTGQGDAGARGEHRPNHIAWALSAPSDHQPISGGGSGRPGPRRGADLSGAAPARPAGQRGAPGSHPVGRNGSALLPGPLPRLRSSGIGSNGAGQRGEGASIGDSDASSTGVGGRFGRVPGPGPVPLNSPAGAPGGSGSVSPGAHGGGPAGRDNVSGPVRPERLTSDPEREGAVRGAAEAYRLGEPGELAAIASAHEVASRWTAPYLVAAVDRVLRRLNPLATGDARFLFVTADDVVPWIVGRLAPDFARRHALWVQWPPTPSGWRHLNAQHPSMLVTDDPATLSEAHQLLSPSAPGSRVVSRLHGPVPDASAMTRAQRMAARDAVTAVVRMAMRAGPETGRTAVYAAANELDRRVAEFDLRSAVPARAGGHGSRSDEQLLAEWLQH